MKQKTILVIDDDPDIVEAIKFILKGKGYKVESAENGTKGMEMVEKISPDLIILDVMMDELREGFFVSRRLKQKDSKYRDIPIIMLTSVKEKTGLDFKSAAGDENWLPVNDYIDKPVEPEVLLEKIGKFLKES